MSSSCPDAYRRWTGWRAGTRIYAAQAGTVKYIGAAQGFGQWIVLDHPRPAGGGTTVYGHMWNALATGLRLGESVAAGQHIAYVGSNGQSSGPHLHFEVHPTVLRAGSQIDPMPWLAGALDPETTLAAAAVPVTDTLYADVSEWQRPVDDSYPYRGGDQPIQLRVPIEAQRQCRQRSPTATVCVLTIRTPPSVATGSGTTAVDRWLSVCLH